MRIRYKQFAAGNSKPILFESKGNAENMIKALKKMATVNRPPKLLVKLKKERGNLVQWMNKEAVDFDTIPEAALEEL